MAKHSIGLFVFLATFPLLADAQDAKQVLKETGVRNGVAVHLGTTDGVLEAGLAEGGNMVVHGLALSQANRDRARIELQNRKLYGLASIELADSLARLPYAENTVNLLIADLDSLGDKAPAIEEIDRVLVPTGVAYLCDGGKWSKRVKPMPAAMDQWHHWDRGADGNPASTDALIAPTTSLRWLVPSSTVHRGGSKVGQRLSDGMVFYLNVDHYVDRLWNRQTRRNHLIARDAFNGTLRWRLPINGVTGGGDQPPRSSLVAVDGRVYCHPKENEPLCALDAVTGRELVRFEGAPPLPSTTAWDKHKDPISKIHFVIRVFDGKVMQTFRDMIYVSDAKSGKLLWKHKAGGPIGWAVAAAGKVFAAVAEIELIKNRASQATPLGTILALNARTGKVLWKNRELAGRNMFRMIHYRDSVFVPTFDMTDKHSRKRRKVARINADTGKILYNVEHRHFETGGHYSIVMARGDEVFVGQQSGFGIDFATGELTRKYNWGQEDNSCADLKCVPNYTFYGLTFLDREGKRITRGQTRSICDVGLFPGYGLLHCSPLGCLCSEYVNGYLALSAEPLAEPIDDAKRLVRGPATANAGGAPNWPRKGEWPMHMANPQRGCAVETDVPAEPKVLWQKQLAQWPEGLVAGDWQSNEKVVGLVTAPTAATGKVFVAAPDAHRLDAFDAATGEAAWSFTAGARIDSPPTIYPAGDDALCLFGCRDGWVYCLNASDGQLVWKFLAAPVEKRICVQGQLESPWPVFGSVAIHDSNVVVAAGRQSAVDGGIYVYKLAPHNGRLLCKTRVWHDPELGRDLPYDRHHWPATRHRRVNDLLVSDGRRLRLWVTPLKEKYADGELVDIETAVPDTRALRYSLRDKEQLVDIDNATWLHSASSGGLLSRRIESVGRHDKKGVSYGGLDAIKICLNGDTLYAVGGSSRKPREMHGGLLGVQLGADGKLPLKPAWKARIPDRWPTDAMIVAGDRIYMAQYNLNEKECTLRVCSTNDGSQLATIPLPSRVVRDGLAAAQGRLYAAGVDGSLTCLGE